MKQTKICKDCGKSQDVSFYHSRPHKGRKAWNVSTCCIDCYKVRQKRYRENNPEKYLSGRYKTLYGITLKDYILMYDLQGGECKICGDFRETLCVDHCHNSNEIRGLLCRQCNMALGLLKENPKIIEKAAEYVSGSI